MATKTAKKSSAAVKQTASRKSGGKTTAGKKRSEAAKNTSARTKKQTNTGRKSSSEQPAAQETRERTDPLLIYEIFLWAVLALAVLLFISYLGFGGSFGKTVSSVAFGSFGLLAYPLPFFLFFMTAFLISNRKSHIAKIKAAAAGGLYLIFCGIFELLMLGFTDGYALREYYEAGVQYRTGGGVIGGFLVNLLCPWIGVAGTYTVLIILAVICIVLITQRSLFAGMKRHGERVYRSAKEGQARHKERVAQQKAFAESIQGPEIYTLPVNSLPQGTAAEDGTILPVNFSAPYSEPRRANRVHGVTTETDLSTYYDQETLSEPAFSETPREESLPMPEFTIERGGKTSVHPGKDAKDDFAQDFSSSLNDSDFSLQEDAFDSSADLTGAVSPAQASKKSGVSSPRGAKSKGSARKAEAESAVSNPQTKEKILAGEREKQRIKEDFFLDDQGFSADAAVPGREAADPCAKAPGKAGGTAETIDTGETQHRSRKPRASAEEIQEGVENVEQQMEETAKKAVPEYQFPPLELLKSPSGVQGGTSDKELTETAQKLQQILRTFGVNAKVTNVSCGPSVTRYELMPEMGVKVSKIVNLADDIKLNLAATDIRIEAPIPGKAAVGIEVPNRESSPVLLRELLESQEFRSHPSNLCYAVGKDIAGKIIVSDIARMPHLLIAGATGSGKSVFINTLIMSIIYKAKPEDVKLIMIDPKVVELSVYNGIPHLFIPVVTDPKKAAGALNWGVAEMEQRYHKFAELGVRDLKGYNAKIESVADIEDENKPEKLPQIVIIVDELADLMMVASGEVEDSICRLAQLARAAGIHLVIATQRPSVDVITGLIKANMPSRIAFAVSSGVDSRTILDMNGAEKLLGNGDMLFSPQTYKKPARIQGAFVSDREVSQVVEFLKEQTVSRENDAKMEEQMAQVQKSSQSAGGSDTDELFADAGRFLIEKDKASIGMLQRWFKIGFNRAARIMDQLAEAGVVGADEGTKPRKVLMSQEQFENYLEQS